MAERWIGLIRAIGPATHGKMSMATLREACEKAGFDDVHTILATGNLLFKSSDEEARIACILRGVVRSFGLDNAVFLRRPADIEALLSKNPFPDAVAKRPNHVLTMFLHAPIGTEAEKQLVTRATGSERIALTDREVVIDYPSGVAGSRLKPASLEKIIQHEGTARNWNTLIKLTDVRE